MRRASVGKVHDPTTLNRQGADVGTQYRSVIYYHSDEQKQEALDSMKKAQSKFSSPIVTEITKFEHFWVGRRCDDAAPSYRRVVGMALSVERHAFYKLEIRGGSGGLLMNACERLHA